MIAGNLWSLRSLRKYIYIDREDCEKKVND